MAGWVLLLAATWITAPRWRDVAQDGEFAFLPENVASRRGGRLFRAAFPSDMTQSAIVLIIFREPDRLRDEGRRFVTETLQPRLGRLTQEPHGRASSRTPAPGVLITGICTFNDKVAGPLLSSEDHQATLVAIELSANFLTRHTIPLVNEVESSTSPTRRPVCAT